MIENIPCSLDNIANDPEFNFITKLQNKNSTFGFDRNDNIEIPYELDSSCNYYDEDSFLEKFSNNSNFSIMSLNIQSLPAKFGNFSNLLGNLKNHKYTPSVICLQEVWKLPDNSLFNLEGYHEPIFKLRNNNIQGGGRGCLCWRQLQL